MVVSRKEKQSFIAKNLIFLRAKKGDTQEEMAKLLDLKGKSSYKAYEDGRALPDIHKLLRLASYFDVSLENLVNKDISTQQPESSSEEFLYEIEVNPIKIAAGSAKGFGDEEYISQTKTIQIPYKPYGISRAFEIIGDSMEPEIKDGSTIIGIKISRDEIKLNRSYVIVTTNGPQCKNIRFGDDGIIYLISKNENYLVKHIREDEVLEMWEVWKTI